MAEELEYGDFRKLQHAIAIDHGRFEPGHPDYDEHHPDNNQIPEPHNIDRAKRVQTLMDGYAKEMFSGDFVDEATLSVLGDFLCDFMHMCRIGGIDFDTVHSQAQFHYDEEVAGRW